jgi:hypothetical protein
LCQREAGGGRGREGRERGGRGRRGEGKRREGKEGRERGGRGREGRERGGRGRGGEGGEGRGKEEGGVKDLYSAAIIITIEGLRCVYCMLPPSFLLHSPKGNTFN